MSLIYEYVCVCFTFEDKACHSCEANLKRCKSAQGKVFYLFRVALIIVLSSLVTRWSAKQTCHLNGHVWILAKLFGLFLAHLPGEKVAVQSSYLDQIFVHLKTVSLLQDVVLGVIPVESDAHFGDLAVLLSLNRLKFVVRQPSECHLLNFLVIQQLHKFLLLLLIEGKLLSRAGELVVVGAQGEHASVSSGYPFASLMSGIGFELEIDCQNFIRNSSVLVEAFRHTTFVVGA